MAMFSKAGNGTDRTARPSHEKSDGNLSIVGEGMRITGELEADGIVRIEGRVEGSVRSVGQVLIAESGVVNGDVHTRQAVVGGQVHGGIYAQERVEIQTGSFIDGDIVTPQIVVQEGGKVNGHIRMAKPDMPPGKKPETQAEEQEATEATEGEGTSAHVWTISA